MGAHSTIRRPWDRVEGSVQRHLAPAPCPVEGSPAGGCIPPLAASVSDWSLQFGENSDLPLCGLTSSDRSQTLHQGCGESGYHLPLFRQFHVHFSPRPPYWASRQISGHWYSCAFRTFPPVAPKGWACASPQMRHRKLPYCSPTLMGFRPAAIARCGLTLARRI